MCLCEAWRRDPKSPCGAREVSSRPEYRLKVRVESQAGGVTSSAKVLTLSFAVPNGGRDVGQLTRHAAPSL